MSDEEFKIDAKKLSEIRERAGLSAKDFGEKVNKSKTCISNYENGWSNPPSPILLAYLILGKASPYEVLKKSST